VKPTTLPNIWLCCEANLSGEDADEDEDQDSEETEETEETSDSAS
jgi:hypothetical protein